MFGVSEAELLVAAGLSAMSRPHGYSFDEGMLLWDALARLTGDACVGLTAGSRMTLDGLGMLGVAFAASRDLAGGLRVLDRTIPLVLRNADVRVEIDERGGRFIYVMPDERRCHGLDAMLAATVTMARECTGRLIAPSRLDLQRPTPAAEVVARYLEVFGVEPRFGASVCALHFDPGALTIPFRGADPQMSALLLGNAPALLAAPTEPPLLSKIESAMARSIDRGEGTLGDVGDLLGMSTRSLQRHLASHGVSFQALRQRALHERARTLLDAGLGVAEVGERLGYRSRTSFERAFRQWQGETPATYQARRPSPPTALPTGRR